ncbi:glycosyltransferase family 2 protein [Aestuariicella hydrocarbonica]|uniref:Glycosyltransferase family 2 protein n=1 Tax=Pseudomaricurvus hydrocarbonicus TaxID=1470433 RepID=A0A9E5JYI7_9GAMM|nr:glycosyltransferase family 2 protein [Aestuariicella hydrocarbonica]NHO64472.1 glycosyltransferase family 2 protein [Aestuariicella hydrocarbonica]
MNLVISIVIYHWNFEELQDCLQALSESLDEAQQGGLLKSGQLHLLYNGPLSLNVQEAEFNIASLFAWPFILQSSVPNNGYGGTNNLVLKAVMANEQWTPENSSILVLNPDVRVDKSAICRSLQRLSENQSYGLICPKIHEWDGRATASPGHKRYPSVAVLGARLLQPLKKLSVFRSLNRRYEYQDIDLESEYLGVVLCSGCFLMASGRFWQETGGFDECYFMYFEDFDLSLRGTAAGMINVYDPEVVVYHAGGGAGKKSWQHQWWFIRSAVKFFGHHGWRWWQV